MAALATMHWHRLHALVAVIVALLSVPATRSELRPVSKAVYKAGRIVLADPANFPIPHSIYRRGRFENPAHFDFSMPSVGALWRYLRTADSSGIPDEQTLDETLPIREPAFVEPGDGTMRATWLGHATVLVQMHGLTFITDPVWCEHCAPVPWLGPPRYRRPPVAIEHLPHIDFALVSHNHFDHLDAAAVDALSRKFEHLRWFVPTALGATVRSFGGRHVTELSWTHGAAHRSVRTNATCEVVGVPAKHWSTRNGFDRYRTLWSGWAVICPQRRFYFAGDTGFCEEEFAAIGRQYGPFDMAAIPIGCYEPSEFFASQHANPEEAVRIHQLVRANQSIAIHWGTYKMGSKEFYLEPKRRLIEAASRLLPAEGAFVATDHGQTVIVGHFKPAQQSHFTD